MGTIGGGCGVARRVLEELEVAFQAEVTDMGSVEWTSTRPAGERTSLSDHALASEND